MRLGFSLHEGLILTNWMKREMQDCLMSIHHGGGNESRMSYQQGCTFEYVVQYGSARTTWSATVFARLKTEYIDLGAPWTLPPASGTHLYKNIVGGATRNYRRVSTKGRVVREFSLGNYLKWKGLETHIKVSLPLNFWANTCWFVQLNIIGLYNTTNYILNNSSCD